MIRGLKSMKKIVSYILVVCMVAGGTIVNLPQSIFAATPTEPTSNITALNGITAVFGNGCSLIIAAGTADGQTVIYRDVNNNGVYDDGDTEYLSSRDMSSYWIFGGGQSGNDVSSTKITMTGGQVSNLIGGGLNSKVSGSVNVDITGGKVNSTFVGGGYKVTNASGECSVGGKITVNVSGNFSMPNGTSSFFVGGCKGDTFTNIDNTTAKDIEININNATNFTSNSLIYASGWNASQDGTTTINITNSPITARIYGGIGKDSNTPYTKSGDVAVTITDSITSGQSIYLGGSNDGVDGNASITVNNSKLNYIYGAGYKGNVTGNVSITVGGTSEITSGVYAGGNSGTVGGSALIDISGTTKIGGDVDGQGVTGTSTLKIAGDPQIGKYSSGKYYGVKLSTFTDEKIIVKGALTGAADRICVILPDEATSGTVVASPAEGITASLTPFYSDKYDLDMASGNVVVGRIITLTAAVVGETETAFDSVTGTLTISGDTFTGLSVGNDITSWFLGAASLGITVTVTSVSGGSLGLSFTGTPSSVKEKTYMQVDIPAAKLTSGSSKSFTSKDNAYWTVTQAGVVDYYLYFDPITKKLYKNETVEYTEQADKWYADEEGNLVLNGFSLTTSSNMGLYLMNDTKLILAEDSVNTIICTENSYEAIYFDYEDDKSLPAIIEGTGMLNIELRKGGDGIDSYANDLYIIDATININSGNGTDSYNSKGIYSSKNLHIQNSDITMNLGKSTNAQGIYCQSGGLNVDDSNIEIIIDGTSDSVFPIYISTSGEVNLEGNVSITVPTGAAIESNSYQNAYGGTINHKAVKANGEVVRDLVKIESVIQKHFVSQTLSNITITAGTIGTRKAIKGTNYTTTITAKNGYVLPGAITVKVGGNTLGTSDYTYNAATGAITIPGAKITGNIEIIATGNVPGGGGNDNGGNDNGGNNNGGNDNGGNNNGGNDNGGNDNGGNDNGGNNNGGDNNGGNNNEGNNNGNNDNSGDVQKDVVKDEKAPQTSFNNNLAALRDLLFTDAEKALIQAGADARIYLEVSDIEDKISSEDKALIVNNIGNLVVGEYIDISLFKQIGDNAAQRISNPNGLISITILIPNDLILNDSSKTRTYKIARIHDGEFTLLDGEFDTNTGEFTFATDKFSTYAIVYQDVDNNVEPPQTGDNSFNLIWALLMASSAVMVSVFTLKKNKIKESEADV